jgi:polyisoprenoid-binding protein YceI
MFEPTGLKKVGVFFRMGGEATFTIKRSDYGMTHMLPEIADEVTVMVNIEAAYELPPLG